VVSARSNCAHQFTLPHACVTSLEYGRLLHSPPLLGARPVNGSACWVPARCSRKVAIGLPSDLAAGKASALSRTSSCPADSSVYGCRPSETCPRQLEGGARVS
jgi:hypothetical protein